MNKADKTNVFVAMANEAKTDHEKQGFERTISMMLTLRKYHRLEKLSKQIQK